MSTEEWIDAWRSRHREMGDERAWLEAETWATETESVGRWTEVANAYRRAGLLERTRDAFKAAMRSAEPDSRVYAYFNYANFLLQQGEYKESLAAFELAWDLKSDVGVGLGFSSALLEAKEDVRALSFLVMESDTLASHAGYWSNLTIAFTRAGSYDDARGAAARAFELEPSRDNRFQHSLAELRASGGQLQEAWQNFECRPKRPNYDDSFGAELTSVESLEQGDRVVVFCEQGIGDILQFIRFAEGLETVGARVMIAGAPRLESLITHSFPSFNYVRNLNEALRLRPKYWVPLLSLPRVLQLECPAEARGRYLVPPNGTTQSGRKSGKKRVGLAWRGNPAYPNDHLRSASLADFRALLDGDTFDVFSLLIAPDEELRGFNLRRLPDGVDESGIFTDTASLVADLDVVVSTDTSIAHLSAGLGIPTFLLLNRAADWRWGSPARSTTWYESMHLVWLDESGFAGGVRSVVSRILND